MTSREQTMDALSLTFQRNAFYKSKFYSVLSVYLISLIIIGLLVGTLIYLIKHPTRPLFFVADQSGRLMVDPPVSEPAVSTEFVAQWAVAALQQSYSSSYFNYRSQLQASQKYFSRYGWHHFMKALVEANNQLGLIQRKLIAVAKVTGKPKLVTEGMLAGHYAWKFTVPMTVTYLVPPAYDEATQFQLSYLVTILIHREPLLQSDNGLGILQVIS